MCESLHSENIKLIEKMQDYNRLKQLENFVQLENNKLYSKFNLIRNNLILEPCL